MYQTLPPPVPAHQNNYLSVHNTTSSKRNSDISLDYDLTSSSDESDVEFKYPSEEHKFWQVHSSTTIIAPPTSEYDAISMDYMPKKNQPQQQQQTVPRISLVALVNQSLSHAFDDVDDEIEKEWETSRINLTKSLTKAPKISLIMTQ